MLVGVLTCLYIYKPQCSLCPSPWWMQGIWSGCHLASIEGWDFVWSTWEDWSDSKCFHLQAIVIGIFRELQNLMWRVRGIDIKIESVYAGVHQDATQFCDLRQHSSICMHSCRIPDSFIQLLSIEAYFTCFCRFTCSLSCSTSAIDVYLCCPLKQLGPNRKATSPNVWFMPALQWSHAPNVWFLVYRGSVFLEVAPSQNLNLSWAQNIS